MLLVAGRPDGRARAGARGRLAARRRRRGAGPALGKQSADQRALTIGGGTTDIQLNIIARADAGPAARSRAARGLTQPLARRRLACCRTGRGDASGGPADAWRRSGHAVRASLRARSSRRVTIFCGQAGAWEVYRRRLAAGTSVTSGLATSDGSGRTADSRGTGALGRPSGTGAAGAPPSAQRTAHGPDHGEQEGAPPPVALRHRRTSSRPWCCSWRGGWALTGYVNHHRRPGGRRHLGHAAGRAAEHPGRRGGPPAGLSRHQQAGCTSAHAVSSTRTR